MLGTDSDPNQTSDPPDNTGGGNNAGLAAPEDELVPSDPPENTGGGTSS